MISHGREAMKEVQQLPVYGSVVRVSRRMRGAFRGLGGTATPCAGWRSRTSRKGEWSPTLCARSTVRSLVRTRHVLKKSKIRGSAF